MSKYKSALPKLPKRGWFEKGDKGSEVVKLQKALNWANKGREDVKPPLVTDGEIGDKTAEAICFFEEIHGKTIDAQFGNVCRTTLRDMNLTGAVKACNFALAIAKDNRFTYGAGKRAHRSGCYFCETNTGKRMKRKEKKGEPHKVKDVHGNYHTYEKTYCCNTYITAAYAHGAKDKTILKICRGGSCCGMEPKDWMRSPNFRSYKAKNLAYHELKMGDVILEPSHVWMYIGHGRLVEASGNDWSADSIASKGNAKRRYSNTVKKNGYVMRYKG